MSKIEFKEDDTHNKIISTLIKEDEPINLTGCDVYITVSNIIYEDKCRIIDETGGKVSYPVKNISHKTGTFEYEYLIVYEDKTQELIPNDEKLEVRIYSRIEEGEAQ